MGREVEMGKTGDRQVEAGKEGGKGERGNGGGGTGRGEWGRGGGEVRRRGGRRRRERERERGTKGANIDESTGRAAIEMDDRRERATLGATVMRGLPSHTTEPHHM